MKLIKILYQRLKEIFEDCKGEANPKELPKPKEIVISGVTYILNIFYKENSNFTAKDKVERLITSDIDAETLH